MINIEIKSNSMSIEDLKHLSKVLSAFYKVDLNTFINTDKDNNVIMTLTEV
jgi:hypothetical protein